MEREIHFHFRLELGDLLRSHNFIGNAFDDIRIQGLCIDWHGDAVNLDIDRCTDREKQIGSILACCQLQ